MANINPYLNFNGNTEEAFLYYKSVFGGEFATVMRYKDIPSENPAPAEDAEKIIHVALPIGKNGMLMGSDRPRVMGEGKQGDLYYVSVDMESNDELNRIYKGLSEGGHVPVPLHQSFWGAMFAIVQDKYGVQWMLNYTLPAK